MLSNDALKFVVDEWDESCNCCERVMVVLDDDVGVTDSADLDVTDSVASVDSYQIDGRTVSSFPTFKRTII